MNSNAIIRELRELRARVEQLWKNEIGGGVVDDYILVRDEKAAGTNGGSFNKGSYQTRNLNTIVSDTGGHCSVAANQITLAAGTYICDIESPAHSVGRNKAILYNITDNAIELIGSADYNPGNDGATTCSRIRGKFTIAAEKTFEVRHRCTTTKTVSGFGYASSYSEIEIYTIAIFRKIG